MWQFSFGYKILRYIVGLTFGSFISFPNRSISRSYTTDGCTDDCTNVWGMQSGRLIDLLFWNNAKLRLPKSKCIFASLAQLCISSKQIWYRIMIISKCVTDTVWVHFKSYVMLCFAVSNMLQIIFIGPQTMFWLLLWQRSKHWCAWVNRTNISSIRQCSIISYTLICKLLSTEM